MSNGIDALFAGGALGSPIGKIIGLAEGNRTPDGGLTDSYYGHTDPGNGAWNVGNYSVNAEYYTCASPEDADEQYHGVLQKEAEQVAPLMEAAGLDPGNALLMVNYLDVWNQSPVMAREGFIGALPYLVEHGVNADTVLQVRIYAGDEGVDVDHFEPTGRAHPTLWTDMDGHVADQSRRMGAIVDAMRALGMEV